MPFAIAKAATSLQIVYADGTIATVTLPTGVFIDSTLMARFAVLGRNVVAVNATNKPVWVDPDGVARPLTVPIPSRAPDVAAGAAGTLTGTFRVRVANVIKDALGNDLAHGPYGPASAPVSVTNQLISYTNIPISGEPSVNCRRIARTATGPGTEYFEAFDIDDNSTTSFTDDSSDASLSLLPIDDELGQAPARISMIVEWKGRLWAVNAANLDEVAFSSEGKLYAWPIEFTLPVRPIGRDRFGVTGFIPRRDELGIGKRDIIWKVVGSDDTDFRMVKLVEGKGIYGADTVVVTRDVGRWLADDGVYEWDSEGVRCISDDDVKGWFSTDDYFNRSLFPSAWARYNSIRNAYDLCGLALAGTSTQDRWVSYDIKRKKWLGPHKSDAFTPSSAGVVYDSNELLVPVMGGTDGYLYKVTPGTFRDGAATAIDMDITMATHTGGAPDITHYWGLFSILSKVLAAGALTITPYVGGLDAAAGTSFTHALTTGREKLRRFGAGRLLKLRFRNAELNQDCEIYGYELPYHELGRR